ncbi:probable lysosomal cobalamin transporter isoform X2 [Oncorhynchus kisutch]|nr:probable lysosomal cobalamin transporter isoform X2 [Oncorhynchus kisutch]
MYFVFTSMAGIRNMGIWFFWIRLYKIRPKRTRPQALLFLCMILLLIVLHTSFMIYSLAPQYVMYGSQNYLLQSPMPPGNNTTWTTKTCDADAPQVSSDLGTSHTPIRTCYLPSELTEKRNFPHTWRSSFQSCLATEEPGQRRRMILDSLFHFIQFKRLYWETCLHCQSK